MTTFLRLLSDYNKESGLSEASQSIRCGQTDERVFEADPELFRHMPGAPFAYWVDERVRRAFRNLSPVETDACSVRQGLATADDFRFVRAVWEAPENGKWKLFAKGGVFSPFYSDVFLAINWNANGDELRAFEGSVVRNPGYYLRPGLTWPRRTKSRLSMRILPAGCIFADKGPAVFVSDDCRSDLLNLAAIFSSQAFYSLVEVQLAAADARPGGAAHSFEVGVIQSTPLPNFDNNAKLRLEGLAKRAWQLRRLIDSSTENSHAFVLPIILRARLDDFDHTRSGEELFNIQSEIDTIVRSAYGFDDVNKHSAIAPSSSEERDRNTAADDEEDDESHDSIDDLPALLSWCVGVAFGRFDCRLAIGEREVASEPDPFDPLPAKSPGMLPDGAAPFHAHPGILVDDAGHPHDLPRLIEDVLAMVDHPAPEGVRPWLRRVFFPHHLRQYSKSRRKAPIYWPLSTASGGYTIWLYYPALTDQTLYTAANDFVGPKLEEMARLAATLRTRSDRGRDEERQFEQLQDLETELKGLQGELLRVATSWKPDHDDGVQITAAPLWRLFRYRPWQTLLKETWEKLGKGDYHWAHLAMTYWRDRVREKCRTDKSLAIAHNMEDLYEPPPEKPGAGRRGRKREAKAS